MVSEQLMQVISLYKNYNVFISHNELAILCNLNKEFFDNILKMFYDCKEENKVLFLETMKKEEFLYYYRYSNILDIITDINSEYIEELRKILETEDITKIPSFYDYLNMFYYITNNPKHILTSEFKHELFIRVPEAEVIYAKNRELSSLKVELKKLLLKQIDDEYEHFVLCNDVIWVEDAAEDFIDDINKFFEYRNKDKEFDANKLIRKIKPKNIPVKKNIIKADFNNNNNN